MKQEVCLQTELWEVIVLQLPLLSCMHCGVDVRVQVVRDCSVLEQLWMCSNCQSEPY